ncbi:MAG: LysR family transcriptional regulator [Myxococcota bacterium]
MNEIPWRGLVALSAIARAGSFRAAAGPLGLSPSGLSHRIRLLEEQLGFRVLNRSTRSVALTPAGEALLRAFTPAQSSLSEALEAIRSEVAAIRGDLRINAPALACRQVLPPLVAALLERHPQIRIHIESDNALVDIVARGLDAGVRLPDQVPVDMISRPLRSSQRFVIVGSPSYLEKMGVPLHPRELHQHRCVGIRFSSGRVYAWGFEHEGVQMRIEAPWVIIVNDALDGIAMARAGVGLAFGSIDDITDDLAAGRLRTVLDDWRPSEPAFHLYYPSRKLQRAPLRALLAVLPVPLPFSE